MTKAACPPPKLQFLDDDGVPLVGGKLYTYSTGTVTRLVTYTDSSQSTPNPNPVILDARGETVLWLADGGDYDFVLTDANDIELDTWESVTSIATTFAQDPLTFLDSNGGALAGGKLYTYAAGTTTPLATYTDSTGNTENANPVVLDSNGEASVYLTQDTGYKFVLRDGTTENAIIWTVNRAHNASAPAAPTDPYFSDVVLLLHGDGVDSGTTFTDSSQYNASVGVTGDVVTDTSDKMFGTASMLFTNIGTYMSFPDAAQYTIGTSDFTIEAWVKRDATSGIDALIGHGNVASTSTGWAVYVTSAGALSFDWRSAGTRRILSTDASQVPRDEWVHVAVTRESGLLRLFTNGNIGPNTTSVGADISDVAADLAVGGTYAAIGNLKGHIDDLRVTIGTARYTASFTPPAAPFPDA